MEVLTQTVGADDAGGPAERAEKSKQLHDILLRALKGLGYSALWGLAAGAATPAIAVANVYKVPMVLALAALASLPTVLVARHLLQVEVSRADLCGALIKSMHRAALLLAGFAPLLAVYAYTSQWFAPVLAQITAGLALICGAVSLRYELGRVEGPRAHVLWLGLITCVTVGLALFQLVALATPVLTVPTMFGHGIDGVAP